MFDAEEHFQQIEKQLVSCQARATVGADGPHFYPNRDKWDAIQFNVIVTFSTGEILDVGDYWQRRGREGLTHTFNYHFMQADGTLIFRLDSHGNEIPYDGTCHIHIGQQEDSEMVLKDDDARLRGHRLSKITFLDAFNLVHRHLKGKEMPWDSAK